MTDEKAKGKPAQKPVHLKADRIRICGKWQKKDYEPSDAERKAWALRCKDRSQNVKTGKPLVDKSAPAQK
jgi:hypothetical protein